MESLVGTATGVVCGLAAADEWLAARVGNPALIKRAVVGEMEEEYKELVELMSAVGCMWVQEGRCDWAADDDDGARLRRRREPQSGYATDPTIATCRMWRRLRQ